MTISSKNALQIIQTSKVRGLPDKWKQERVEEHNEDRDDPGSKKPGLSIKREWNTSSGPSLYYLVQNLERIQSSSGMDSIKREGYEEDKGNNVDTYA